MAKMNFWICLMDQTQFVRRHQSSVKRTRVVKFPPFPQGSHAVHSDHRLHTQLMGAGSPGTLGAALNIQGEGTHI